MNVIRFPPYADLREPHPDMQARRLTWAERLSRWLWGVKSEKRAKVIPINLAHERIERVRRKARGTL